MHSIQIAPAAGSNQAADSAGDGRGRFHLLRDRDLSFLVEATRLLSDSLDVEKTLATVARLSLPHFGSWCVVDLCGPDETRRIAIIHPDPEQQFLADQLRTGWPPRRDDPLGAPCVVRTRRSEVIFPVTDEMMVKAARSPENLAILRALEIGSFMTIPLLARGLVLGAITYVSPNHGDSFSAEDLALAEDLAARCAIAIDNSRLMQDVKEAKADAEESNLVKMRFLSTMSHELRTPLNAIAGYADLLEMGLRGALTGAQLKDVRRIQHNQRHLLALVETVLSYAKVDAGSIEFELENVSLAQVAAEVGWIIAPLAEANGITCVGFQPKPNSELTVYADAAKLQQILINLAANAIKFSTQGDTIELARELVGDRVAIKVSDNGIGIAPEYHERIFQPFLQVDESLTRKGGGTGLGLAISHELAMRMGGELSVQSALGQGSVFTLTLPGKRNHGASDGLAVGSGAPHV